MNLAEEVENAKRAITDIADDPRMETDFERLYVLKAMLELIEDRIWDLKLNIGLFRILGRIGK